MDSLKNNVSARYQKYLSTVLACSSIIWLVFLSSSSVNIINGSISAVVNLSKNMTKQFIANDFLTEHEQKLFDDTIWKQRLKEYQDALTVIRYKFKSQGTNESAMEPLKNRTVIDEKEPGFINRLLNQSEIYSYLYEWTYYDVRKQNLQVTLPVQHYFKPFASPPVCDNFVSWLSQWKNIISCNISEEMRQLTTSNVTSIVGRRPFVVAESKFYSYISIIRNAVVNVFGNVIHNEVIIIPKGCRSQDNDMLSTDKNTAMYDEVFVTSHFWGTNYYHMTIENLPRLATYVDFLRNHSDIRIHMIYGSGSPSDRKTVNYVEESLAAFGIDPKRRVYGTVKGRIVYLPRATPCGQGLLPEVQILAARFHDYISNSLNESRHSSLVLIIREGAKNGRNMARHIYDKIFNMLVMLLKNSSLQLETFDDKHQLSHSNVLRMFYRARMVIGLHGAGLANVVYSRPGTVVIEMICQPPDLANPCYAHTAGVLGHRFHAIPAYGCSQNVTISIPMLKDIVSMYVNFIKQQLLY